MCIPKITLTLNNINFPDTIYEHTKKQLNSFVHSWDTADYRVPWPKSTHPHLTMSTQQLFEYLLAFLCMYKHAKNQLDSSIYLEIEVPCPLLNTTSQKLLKKFSTFLNLHHSPYDQVGHNHRPFQEISNTRVAKYMHKYC